jgi:MFS family permease
MLAVLSLARVSMGLNLQVVAAVAPFMIAEIGLSYAEIGSLIGVFLLPGALIALPGGLVSRRFGDRRALIGAMLLLLAGTGLLAWSPGFWPAMAARAISGAGGTLLTMLIAKMTTDWFAGRELSTAIGVLLGTFPLGVAAVMAGLPLVAAGSSWQNAVTLVALATALILLVVVAFLREAPEAAAGRTGDRPPLWVITRHEAGMVLLAGGAFALLNAGLVIFTSFVPTLLVAQGHEEVQAGLLTSWSSWILIGTLPLAGWLLNGARRSTLWMIASATCSALVCVSLVAGGPAWFWLVLFGVALGPITVGSMVLPGEVLRSESRSTGFGLFFTANYIGFGLLPALAGLVLDLSGSAAATLVFDALVFAAIVPLILLFRWLQHVHVVRSPEPVD